MAVEIIEPLERTVKGLNPEEKNAFRTGHVVILLKAGNSNGAAPSGTAGGKQGGR